MILTECKRGPLPISADDILRCREAQINAELPYILSNPILHDDRRLRHDVKVVSVGVASDVIRGDQQQQEGPASLITRVTVPGVPNTAVGA